MSELGLLREGMTMLHQLFQHEHQTRVRVVRAMVKERLRQRVDGYVSYGRLSGLSPATLQHGGRQNREVNQQDKDK